MLNKHAPVQNKKIKQKPFTPWITDHIKFLIKLKDKAYHKYIKRKTEANLQYYRDLKNYTKHAIIREKVTYFKSVSHKNGKDF